MQNNPSYIIRGHMLVISNYSVLKHYCLILISFSDIGYTISSIIPLNPNYIARIEGSACSFCASWLPLYFTVQIEKSFKSQEFNICNTRAADEICPDLEPTRP